MTESIMSEILELNTTEEVIEAIENTDNLYILCRPINTWVGLRILRMGYDIDDDNENHWIISTEQKDEIKEQYSFHFN